MFLIYKFLLYISYPFLKVWVFYRTFTGKEDKTRLQERFGLTGIRRPQGKLFWFHGASIGESLTYLPLLHYFHEKHPQASFLMTSGTRGAADILSKKLPSRCIHQYIPLDHPCFVQKFLNHWKPTFCFWTESDFWPLLLEQTKKIAPIFLLNGRLSTKSFSSWRHFPNFFYRILGCFHMIFPQTTKDGERFLYFKGKNIRYLGNLKFAAPPLSSPIELEGPLQTLLKNRPFWIASNTHKGEEEIVLQAHKILLSKIPKLLLVLILRHPERTTKEIIPLLTSYGLSYKIRSKHKGKDVSAENVYVVNTFGEVLSFYSLSHLVFLGGSLIPGIGGHNLLEPLRFYNKVFSGPYMHNNQDIARKSMKQKILIEVRDAKSLAKAVENHMLEKIDPTPIEKFLKEQNVLSLYMNALEKELKDVHVANT